MSNRARYPEESYEDYRQHLRDEEAAIKWHLRGKYAHVSESYSKGSKGELLRKGETYKRPSPKPPSKRDRWRQKGYGN